MGKHIVLPALAVAGGLAALALRLWQLRAAYDPATQLFRSGALPTRLLLVLLLLLALALLLGLRGIGRAAPRDFLPAFRCPSPAFMAGMAASAFLFLGAGLLTLLEGLDCLTLWRADPASVPLTYPAALLLCGLLCFPAGAGTLAAGRACFRGRCPDACSLLVLFPPMAVLPWLFASHLSHGTDPVLMRYGPALAAAAAMLLALYWAAAFFHRRPHPGLTAFSALMGVVLGLLSLADASAPFQLALTAACLPSCLSYACALLRNCFGPPWPERMPSGAYEDEEDPDEADKEE